MRTEAIQYSVRLSHGNWSKEDEEEFSFFRTRSDKQFKSIVINLGKHQTLLKRWGDWRVVGKRNNASR